MKGEEDIVVVREEREEEMQDVVYVGGKPSGRMFSTLRRAKIDDGGVIHLSYTEEEGVWAVSEPNYSRPRG